MHLLYLFGPKREIGTMLLIVAISLLWIPACDYLVLAALGFYLVFLNWVSVPTVRRTSLTWPDDWLKSVPSRIVRHSSRDVPTVCRTSPRDYVCGFVYP